MLRMVLDSGETARHTQSARSIYRSMSTERSLTIRRCWLPRLARETRTGLYSLISSIIYSIDACRRVNDCCKKLCPGNPWWSCTPICAIRLGTALGWITAQAMKWHSECFFSVCANWKYSLNRIVERLSWESLLGEWTLISLWCPCTESSLDIWIYVGSCNACTSWNQRVPKDNGV